ELGAGAEDDFAQCVVRRARLAVETVRRHRVERVGDKEDPGAKRDLRSGEAVRISGAVPAFMVVEHPLRHRTDAQALQHSRAKRGMLLEDGPLGLRQGRRLAQQVLRKGELAEVVKAPRELCELELFTGEADARGQSNRKLGDTLRVIPAVDVSGIDGTCK